MLRADMPSRAFLRVCASLLLFAGCEPERPPRPDDERPPAAEGSAGEVASEASVEPGTTPAVYTYAAERGAFADTSKPETVPEASRGLVKVSLLDGPAPPGGAVWVGNLREPGEDGKVALRPVPRDDFEELALGQGLSSKVEIPEGLAPPAPVAAAHGDVIVYKTAWCGVCKKVESYLKKKGVPYTAKDIEKDRSAAAELQTKAAAQKVKTGSVPVIDVKGTLIVGFDRARLEKLL
jgi:glutaredoxin